MDEHTSDPLGLRPLRPGDRVGVWRILDEIGGGGMGRVYLAERDDPEFRQRVALKTVRADLDREGLRRRFREESRILAALEHANVARLLDAGETEAGVPYVAMEYVEGLPVDAYCDAQRLSTEERLRLFLKICDAVHDAHRKLVVHRDLKPANILVTADREPKLLDFGIARLLDAEDGSAPPTRTLAGHWTPDYASPEQVRREPVTTASDVYSLGVLLYELLTGFRPYRVDALDPQESERVICEQDPDTPSTALTRPQPDTDLDAVCRCRRSRPARLKRQLSGDLDTIVMKALRKEPERRYGSAAQLAADVRRYLDGRPVQARPDSLTYRVGKFVRRNPWGVGATALLTLLIAAGGAAATVQARRFAEERDRADAERRRAESASRFLVESFDVADAGEPTVRGVLERGAGRVESALSDEPGMQAEMMLMMGEVYGNLGDFPDARNLVERSIAILRDRHGDGSVEVARAESRLGTILRGAGEFDAAAERFESALAVQRAELGTDHIELGRTLSEYGYLKFEQGKYDEAEPMLQRALEIAREQESETDVLTALNNLGVLYYLMDDFDRARPLYEEALALRIENYGPDHPDTIISRNNMAELYRREEDLERALPLLEENARISRKVFADHPRTAIALNNLALAQQADGRLDDAEPNYREALAMRLRILGEEHPDVANARHNLAWLLLERGRFDESVDLFRRALDGFERALGPDHPVMSLVHRNLGSALEGAERWREAEASYRASLAALDVTAAPNRPAVAGTEFALGRMLCKRGRRGEGAALLESARDQFAEFYGPEDRDTLRARDLLEGCRSGGA